MINYFEINKLTKIGLQIHNNQQYLLIHISFTNFVSYSTQN